MKLIKSCSNGTQLILDEVNDNDAAILKTAGYHFIDDVNEKWKCNQEDSVYEMWQKDVYLNRSFQLGRLLQHFNKEYYAKVIVYKGYDIEEIYEGCVDQLLYDIDFDVLIKRAYLNGLSPIEILVNYGNL